MDVKTILNEEENKLNEAKKAKLEALIRSGDAILMAGAGVTASIYCSWSQLMGKFQGLAQEVTVGFAPRGENEDYLQFADRIKSAIGEDRYYSTIYEEFQDRSVLYHEFHQTIVKMLIGIFDLIPGLIYRL